MTSGRRLHALVLMAVVLVAAFVRLWRLDGHETGNIYYAAAVRSMASSRHAFLYASFDPGGFLGLDKPPVAFWIQAATVRLLGFSGLVLHLPQVIEGIVAVVLVYRLSRESASPWGALAAALVVAVNPASVAADRSNLADSCLVMLLLLAAGALLRAARGGRIGWLLATGALVGVAFNAKLLVAWAVLPTFGLVYWLAAGGARRRRLAQLGGAAAAMLCTSFAWPAMVDLTPASARPYVGDTRGNSAFGLAFGSKGLGNVAGRGRPPGPPAGGPGMAPPGAPAGPGRAGGGFADDITGQGGRPGPLRLLNRDLAGHIAWLFPVAAIGALVAVRGGGLRLPLTPYGQAAVLWIGWFATYAVLFSFAHAPIHPYYLNVLAPPVAGLTGMAVSCLGRQRPEDPVAVRLATAAVLLTAAWQALLVNRHPEWAHVLTVALAAGGLAAVVGLAVMRAGHLASPRRGRIGMIAISSGAAALIVCPALWSLTPALAPGARMVPIADPVLLRFAGTRAGEPLDEALMNLLGFLSGAGRGARFAIAAPDIHIAAAVIVLTGRPAMAYGGFLGSDPILSVERLAAMTRAGEVRYVLLREPRGPANRPVARGELAAWVRANGREVPSGLWRPPPSSEQPALMPGWGPVREILRRTLRDPTLRLYDCRPTAG